MDNLADPPDPGGWAGIESPRVKLARPNARFFSPTRPRKARDESAVVRYSVELIVDSAA
jgi:hypothetical protein